MQTQKCHLWPHTGERAKLVNGLRDIRIKVVPQALCGLPYVPNSCWPWTVWKGEGEWGEEEGTNWVFRRQKPTLLMASAMTCSSAASTASRLRVPPSPLRSLSTAASVTSSFVCEESMSEMSVAKRLFCTRQSNHEKE